jgi:hypothetical protein
VTEVLNGLGRATLPAHVGRPHYVKDKVNDRTISPAP